MPVLCGHGGDLEMEVLSEHVKNMIKVNMFDLKLLDGFYIKHMYHYFNWMGWGWCVGSLLDGLASGPGIGI